MHDDPPDDRRRQFAERILTNTRRMQRIVDDLLDLSRIESGGWVPKSQPLDLATIAGDTLAASRDAAAAKQVILEADVAADARHIIADETAVRQILGNLVENAIRHTAKGSIAIFARRRDNQLEIGVGMRIRF